MSTNKVPVPATKNMANYINFISSVLTGKEVDANDMAEFLATLKTLIHNRDAVKRELQSDLKNTSALLKRIVANLSRFSKPALESLDKMLQEIGNDPAPYNRCLLQAKAIWGTPDYLAGNIEDGIKMELVSNRSKAYEAMRAAVNTARRSSGTDKNNSLLKLDAVVRCDDPTDGEYYIAFVTGGNNNTPDWTAYLDSLKSIVTSPRIKQAWLEELNTDTLDDLYFALIGFRMKSAPTIPAPTKAIPGCSSSRQ